MRKILLLSALAMGALSAQDAKKLVFNPTAGLSYKYSLLTESSAEMKNPLNGQMTTVDTDLTMEYLSEVTKVEKGLKFSNEVTKVALSTEMPGMPAMEYDSDDEDPGMLGAMLGGIAGSESSVVFDGSGEIVEQEEAEVNDAAASMGLSADSLVSSIGSAYKMFPDKPVKVGESWKVSDMFEVSPGQEAKMELTVKLEGYEKLNGAETAKLSFSGSLDGELDVAGQKMSVKSDDYKGVAWHDLKLNTTRKSVTEVAIVMSVPEGQEVGAAGMGSISTTSTITQKLLSAE